MNAPAIVAMVLLIACLIVVGPLLTIWSLNTLFPVLNIDYTLSTWFAALLLGGLVHGTTTKGK